MKNIEDKRQAKELILKNPSKSAKRSRRKQKKITKKGPGALGSVPGRVWQKFHFPRQYSGALDSVPRRLGAPFLLRQNLPKC